MKPYRTAAITFAFLCVFLVACQTTGYTQRRSAAVEDPAITNLRADMRILDDRLNKIAGDLQALQVNHDRLQQQVAALQQQASSLQAQAGNGVTTTTISQLQQRIDAVDAARKRDAELIVSQVSAELAKIGGGAVSSGRRSPGATSKGGARTSKKDSQNAGGGTEQGYEHEVAKGQSLSAIAKTYGVTVEAIKKANNMKNDTVFIGQKLFIPKQ